jgi:hypothetical protein
MTNEYTLTAIAHRPEALFDFSGERASYGSLDNNYWGVWATQTSGRLIDKNRTQLPPQWTRANVQTVPAAAGGAVRCATVAVGGLGYQVIAWQWLPDGATGQYRVGYQVLKNGLPIATNYALAASSVQMAPKLLYAGGKFWLGYRNNSGNLVCRSLDPSGSLTWGAEVTIISAMLAVSLGGSWDWDANSTVIRGGVATAGFFNEFTLNASTGAGTAGSSVAVAGTARKISAYTNDTATWIAYWDSATSIVRVWVGGSTYALTAALSSTSDALAVGPAAAATSATVIYQTYQFGVADRVVRSRQIGNAGALGTETTIFNSGITSSATDAFHDVELASKPFYADGHYHFWAFVRSPSYRLDRYAVLLSSADLERWFLSSIALSRTAVVPRYTISERQTPPKVVTATVDTATEYYAPCEESRDPNEPNAVTVLSWRRLTSPAVARGPGEAYFSGGALAGYDGTTALVHSSVTTPHISSIVASGGAGTTGNTRFYVACYAWRDAFGNVFRSEPGNQFASGSSGTGTLTVTVRNLMLLPQAYWSATSVTVELYATDPGSTVFELVSEQPVGRGSSTTSFAFSVLAGALASPWTGAPEFLYTTGGVLSTHAPPGFDTLINHKGRLFGASGSRVYYTHQLIPGEGPVWPDAFVLQLPATVTGLAPLDDALVIFTADAIYAVYGEGPSRLGQNAYPAPVKVPSEVGCIERRSVVSYRDGVAFRSRRGIELLQRGGGVVPLLTTSVRWGAAAGYSVLRDYSETLSVVDRPDHTQLRWLVGPYPYRGDRILCWDYARGAWSVESAAAMYFTCSGMWPNNEYALGYRDTPRIYVQSEDTDSPGSAVHTDGPTGGESFASAYVWTSAMRPAGMMGWGRVRAVRALGEYISDCDLTINVAYDGADSSAAFGSDGNTWALTSLTHSTEGPIRIRYAPKRQKCEALAVEIKLDGNTTTKSLDGAALHGISVEYEPTATSKHRAKERG